MTRLLFASTSRHAEWGGPKRYVRIVIHDTLKEFRDTMGDHESTGPWSEAAGCFQPGVRRERYNKSSKKWEVVDPHYAGVIRLVPGHSLHTEAIVHECVHAAAHIYRQDCASEIFLGENCRENEEHFAYIVGDLAASVDNALYKGRVY